MQDGIDYLKTGETAIFLNGQRHLIRLPKLREFRQVKQMLLEAHERERADLRRKADENKAARDDKREMPHQVLEGDTAEADIIGIVLHVSHTMCEPPLPENDDDDVLERVADWPVWLVNPKIVNDLVSHWREVPLVHG